MGAENVLAPANRIVQSAFLSVWFLHSTLITTKRFLSFLGKVINEGVQWMRPPTPFILRRSEAIVFDLVDPLVIERIGLADQRYGIGNNHPDSLSTALAEGITAHGSPVISRHRRPKPSVPSSFKTTE